MPSSSNKTPLRKDTSGSRIQSFFSERGLIFLYPQKDLSRDLHFPGVLFDFSRLIHSPVGILDDMEVIDNHTGLKYMLLHTTKQPLMSKNKSYTPKTTRSTNRKAKQINQNFQAIKFKEDSVRVSYQFFKGDMKDPAVLWGSGTMEWHTLISMGFPEIKFPISDALARTFLRMSFSTSFK